MGTLVSSFNPWDPSDPSYQTQEDDLYNQAYNLPEDTQMAGSNFYPSDEMTETGEMGDTTPANLSGAAPQVVSFQEEQFENEM